jgi:hypothetical protein
MQSPIRRWVPRRCRRGRTSAPLPDPHGCNAHPGGISRILPVKIHPGAPRRRAWTTVAGPARRIVDSMVLLRLTGFVRLAICDPEGLCRQSNSSLSVSTDGPYELLSIGPTARPWSMPTSPPTSVATALVRGR